MLQHLDGKPTVAQAAAKAAGDVGITGAELKAYRETAGKTVRRLVELGFLEPE